MNFDLNKSENRLEYGQIILGHIDKILKLSLVDICSGSVAGRYKSAVISLGDSLTAYFGDEMNNAQEKFNLDSKKDVRRLGAYRNYFRELLKLVKRVDYFKNAVYGEDKDEVVSEGGDEDD